MFSTVERNYQIVQSQSVQLRESLEKLTNEEVRVRVIHGGVGAVSIMIMNTGITLPALLSFIAFNMTTIPCFAAVAAAKGEMQNKNQFNWTLVFWVLTSYILSSAIYLIGTAWWTAFIYLAVAVVAITIIKFINKKRETIGK